MRFVVKHLDGRIETGEHTGENMTLGLGGTLIPCLCGVREFVDAWADWRGENGEISLAAIEGGRPPDRVCSCGRKWWYFDADEDHTGFLH